MFYNNNNIIITMIILPIIILYSYCFCGKYYDRVFIIIKNRLVLFTKLYKYNHSFLAKLSVTSLLGWGKNRDRDVSLPVAFSPPPNASSGG